MSTPDDTQPPSMVSDDDGTHFFDTGYDQTSVLARPGSNRVRIAHAPPWTTPRAARALARALNTAADLAEQPAPSPRPVPPDKIGVHTTHCCRAHGCKYGNDNCLVTTRQHKQEFPCELCADTQ